MPASMIFLMGCCLTLVLVASYTRMQSRSKLADKSVWQEAQCWFKGLTALQHGHAQFQQPLLSACLHLRRLRCRVATSTSARVTSEGVRSTCPMSLVTQRAIRRRLFCLQQQGQSRALLSKDGWGVGFRATRCRLVWPRQQDQSGAAQLRGDHPSCNVA